MLEHTHIYDLPFYLLTCYNLSRHFLNHHTHRVPYHRCSDVLEIVMSL